MSEEMPSVTRACRLSVMSEKTYISYTCRQAAAVQPKADEADEHHLASGNVDLENVEACKQPPGLADADSPHRSCDESRFLCSVGPKRLPFEAKTGWTFLIKSIFGLPDTEKSPSRERNAS